jgi:hypothetical protein
MIKSFIKSSISNWNRFFSSFFFSAGSIFLFLEAYEVLKNTDAPVSFDTFILFSILISVCFFIVDGIFISGFYVNKIELLQKNFGAKVTIEFGDIFRFNGVKAIGVNDFFDSVVDEKIISSATLHGAVLNKYWRHNVDEWDKKVEQELSLLDNVVLNRMNGKTKRYEIGATAEVSAGTDNFLFVALAKTSVEDGVTIANAENIISATRGLLVKARATCANRPLIIPLFGSGLARAGIANNVLLDLIICGIFEETKSGKITSEIKLVLDPGKRDDFDLVGIRKKWK